MMMVIVRPFCEKKVTFIICTCYDDNVIRGRESKEIIPFNGKEF